VLHRLGFNGRIFLTPDEILDLLRAACMSAYSRAMRPSRFIAWKATSGAVIASTSSFHPIPGAFPPDEAA
jgi:hypothetical protein